MKGYSTSPKASALLKPHNHIVLCHIQDTRKGSYSSAEKQSVYSTGPSTEQTELNVKTVLFQIIQFSILHSLAVKRILF